MQLEQFLEDRISLRFIVNKKHFQICLLQLSKFNSKRVATTRPIPDIVGQSV